MLKNSFILKRLVILIIACRLFFPAGVLAQSGGSFSSVDLALWPEFDRPSMLVIYRIALSAQMKLPAEIQFRIPSAAGAPNAVAARQPDGSLVNIPYTQNPDGEWSTLVFQATAADLQIEYYDPGLVRNGRQRQFKYTWPGDYAVDAFNVEVQEPVGSSQMTVQGGATTSKPGPDGLTYLDLSKGTIAANQGFEIDVAYQKADDQLSSDNVPVEPSGPLNDTATGRTTLTSILPWLLGLLGLMLLFGGGLWYWQSGRERATEPERPSRHKPADRGEMAEESEEDKAVYCHQCGKRAGPGDRFCRACGTPLRLG